MGAYSSPEKIDLEMENIIGTAVNMVPKVVTSAVEFLANIIF